MWQPGRNAGRRELVSSRGGDIDSLLASTARSEDGMNVVQPVSRSRVSARHMSTLPRPMANAASGVRAWRDRVEQRRFVSIAAVFGRHGGMVTAEDANRRALLRSGRSGSVLARQICTR